MALELTLRDMTLSADLLTNLVSLENENRLIEAAAGAGVSTKAVSSLDGVEFSFVSFVWVISVVVVDRLESSTSPDCLPPFSFS